MLDSIRNEQVKDEHCRRLEAALDGLDTELNKISRSRHELWQGLEQGLGLV